MNHQAYQQGAKAADSRIVRAADRTEVPTAAPAPLSTILRESLSARLNEAADALQSSKDLARQVLGEGRVVQLEKEIGPVNGNPETDGLLENTINGLDILRQLQNATEAFTNVVRRELA